jgi:prepilin-type processing-associated H-X9-DG protein
MGGYPNGCWLSDRHADGANLLYLDGHVELVENIMQPNDRFFGYYWHRKAPYAWYSHDDINELY